MVVAASRLAVAACSLAAAIACSCCSFLRFLGSTAVVPCPVGASLGRSASSAVEDEPELPLMREVAVV